MKILFLSDDFPPQSFGGAGISTYDLARGMKKAGHEVFVITTCRKESESGELNYDGLKVFRIASNYPGRWRSYVSLYNKPVVRQVKKLLQRIRPDVVHANNIHFYLSYHALKLSKRYARVVVITFRDVMSFNFGKLETRRYLEKFDARTSWLDHARQAKKRWNLFRNFVIKKYLSYTDRLFSISGSLKGALEQNGIKNVEVLHTGVLVSEWQTLPDEVKGFKEQYNLGGKKVVFFGGRLSDAKGASVVSQAMELVSKELPEATLLAVGEGGIGWIGRERIKLAYAASDVVLVPSICLDTFPRVVLEAMASGKPVIGTCYGGAPEAIEDGVTGYVVNPFNIKEMSEKIISLLRDSEKAEKFGKAGRERVRTKFNLDEKVAEYLKHYNSLLK